MSFEQQQKVYLQQEQENYLKDQNQLQQEPKNNYVNNLSNQNEIQQKINDQEVENISQQHFKIFLAQIFIAIGFSCRFKVLINNFIQINYYSLSVFVVLTLTFHILQIFWNIFAMCQISSQRKSEFQYIHYIIELTSFIIGIFGLTLLNTDEFKILSKDQSKNGNYEFTYLLNVMVIIRLAVPFLYMFVIFLLLIFLVFYKIEMRKEQSQSQTKNILKFIEGRGKIYNFKLETNDVCSICLEDLKKNKKKVADLGCSGKHVFHIDCIKKWVKFNDNCPNCRQSILIKKEQINS